MTKPKNLTLGSLFDGIGGFPYAASFYGVRPLWASEILPAAVSVTKRHFPEMAHVGDITRLDGGTLAPVDVIAFGSPCQGLSMAGKRLGLADERSGLFLEAIRIIREMQEATHGRYPQIAVWENVPGAFSSDGGRDFKAVLEAFTKTKISMPPSGKWANAGMVRSRRVDLAWCVYDAQYFGTAQRRRRIFLIADFGGFSAGKILFVPKSLRGYFAAGGTPRQGAPACFKSGAGTADEQPEGRKINCLNGWDTRQSRVFTKDGPSPTLAGADGAGSRNPAGLVYAAFMGGQSASSGSTGYSEQVSPTLRGASGSTMTPCVCEPQLARTLTARGDSSPCADRGQNIVAMGVNGDHAGPVAASYCKGAGARSGKERDMVLCAATGQADAEILSNQSPTLSCNHEAPFFTHPPVSGTLCGSGAGLSRSAGMASEPDFCVVTTAADCRNLREIQEKSGVLQSKTGGGYSLNDQNPIRIGHAVRRLTPVECERLQGFPDGWTAYGQDGKPISDSRRYQMLGNSVAIPCVAYLMGGIRDALKGR